VERHPKRWTRLTWDDADVTATKPKTYRTHFLRNDMYAFELTRAKSVADATAALAKSGGKPLAGGQSLVGAMKLRLAQPGTLVDLSAIPELRGIKTDGGALAIGAMTRHAEVAASATVKSAIPSLCALAAGIGDRQVRNLGTIGGSLANNDPAADWPAAVLGLGATVVTSRRKIAADDFFKGMYETALGADEIITAVSFPVPKKAGYAKFPNPASRFALVGVFVADTGNGVRVAITGAAPSVFRSDALEKALGGSFTSAAAKGVKIDPQGLTGDLHGSPEYRAHLIAVMAARAVSAAG
jgi:carbon-monoxide dehydrogenase medium subunit